MRLLLLISLCLTASSSIYKVETAREDGDWTLLYREVPKDISEDGYVIFLIPSEWTPADLSNYDSLHAEVTRMADTATVTFRRTRP